MKKAVVSVPARVKLRPNSAISQGKSDGITRWKKCEVPWANPTSDITSKSPARLAATGAPYRMPACSSLGHHRLQGALVDRELEDVRARVVSHHVEIVLAARDLVEIELRGEDRLLLEGRPSEDLSGRVDDAAAPAHQQRLGSIAQRIGDVRRHVGAPQDLAGAEHETA